MSIGINLLISLIKKSANLLGSEFDTEILEMHHRHKKDAFWHSSSTRPSCC